MIHRKIFLISNIFCLDWWWFNFVVWRLSTTWLYFVNFSDGVSSIREWAIRVQNKPVADVWIYDQLHPQTETSTGEIHDEQCSGKLHHFTGMSYSTVNTEKLHHFTGTSYSTVNHFTGMSYRTVNHFTGISYRTVWS